jgi:hypothetical protein
MGKRFLQWILLIFAFAIGGGIAVTISLEREPAPVLTAGTLEQPVERAWAAAEASPLRARPLSERLWKVFAEEQQMLLRRSITLMLPALPGLPQKKWHLALVEHPEWILMKQEGEIAHATLDEEAIATYLEKTIVPAIPAPKYLRIVRIPPPDTLYATVEGEIAEGWVLQTTEAIPLLIAALRNGAPSFVLPLERSPGQIINATTWNLGKLELLSRGRSNFAGSVPNRIFNVKKALNDHVNNIFLLPGQTFSFNAMVGKVDSANGWKSALGIFNGKDLDFTPGGGICQSSTTLYRSVLQAGLPILAQRNHSLYVTYYGAHGEGLDATIYPGSQDFSFLNDTQYPILIQARDEGTEAIVEIYGTSDGRHVTLEGPFRWHEAPSDITELHGRDLYKNEIAWRQIISHSDGRQEKHALVSRYQNYIPAVMPEGADIL